VNQSYTKAERQHVERVKSLPCSVCDAPAPSAAHHIRQDCAYTVVALCESCHTGKNGIHGQKIMWKINKLDELQALNITLGRLLNGNQRY
jgi:uncharacterized protein HemY